MKKIAVITTVRNDRIFAKKWVEYYAHQIGASNLYMIIDGEDQEIPTDNQDINIIIVPHISQGVIAGDKSRAARASKLARKLFEEDGYEIVIATDIDEFLVLDPDCNQSLGEYLSELDFRGALSALGLDVVQKTDVESQVDLKKNFLEQRRFAVISDRYTKASIVNQPLEWGSGQHRVRGRNFRIDPNLYLFHFGNLDREFSLERSQDDARKSAGWQDHQQKRDKLYDEVRNARAIDGDARFSSARRAMSVFRPLYAWNKPGRLARNAVVTIPPRFKEVV